MIPNLLYLVRNYNTPSQYEYQINSIGSTSTKKQILCIILESKNRLN